MKCPTVERDGVRLSVQKPTQSLFREQCGKRDTNGTSRSIDVRRIVLRVRSPVSLEALFPWKSNGTGSRAILHRPKLPIGVWDTAPTTLALAVVRRGFP